MSAAQKIEIIRTDNPKPKPADVSKLGFGSYFTDHMFIMNYDEGKGWHSPRIVPYGPLLPRPCRDVPALRAGGVRGLKAYRTPTAKRCCSVPTGIWQGSTFQTSGYVSL